MDLGRFLHLALILLSLFSVREQLKELTKQYEKSENDLKALQSVGQVSENYLYIFGNFLAVLFIFWSSV